MEANLNVLNDLIFTAENNLRFLHWNIKTPYFIYLHEFYGKHYKILGDWLDRFSERLRQLGAIAKNPLDSNTDYIGIYSTIKETDIGFGGKTGMYEAVAIYDALKAITLATMRDPIDKVTEDMAIDFLAYVDNTIYELRSSF